MGSTWAQNKNKRTFFLSARFILALVCILEVIYGDHPAHWALICVLCEPLGHALTVEKVEALQTAQCGACLDGLQADGAFAFCALRFLFRHSLVKYFDVHGLGSGALFRHLVYYREDNVMRAAAALEGHCVKQHLEFLQVFASRPLLGSFCFGMSESTAGLGEEVREYQRECVC